MTEAAAAALGGGTPPVPPAANEPPPAPAAPPPPPAPTPPAANEPPAPPATPEWMQGFAEELRSDPDLIRYKTSEDMAKALKETRAWARGRIPMPGAEDEAGWTELGQRLRPEKAEDYAIELQDGTDPALADSFRAFAFDTGIPKRWAEATAMFFNEQTSKAMEQLGAANTAEVKALELELGPDGYARRIEATNRMLAAAGLEVDVADAMAQLVGKDDKGGPAPGAGKALRALFTLAEKTGELGKVDPADVQLRMGALRGDAALAKAAEMVASTDPQMIAALAKPDSPERKRYEALMEAGKQR